MIKNKKKKFDISKNILGEVFGQKALKIAAILALAIGTGSINSSAQAFELKSKYNIKSQNDIESQVLKEQTKFQKIKKLNKSKQVQTPINIARTNTYTISSDTLNSIKTSLGTDSGVIDYAKDLDQDVVAAKPSKNSLPIWSVQGYPTGFAAGIEPKINDGTLTYTSEDADVDNYNFKTRTLSGDDVVTQYNLINLSTQHMTSNSAVIWEKTDQSGVSGYTWRDNSNKIPWATNLSVEEDGSGGLKKASGAIRFNLSYNGSNQTQYYIYRYTVPTGYSQSSRLSNLTADLTNTYFYGLNGSSAGAAIGNTSNNGFNISADFIGNKTSSSGGAINNTGKIGNITGNFISNTSTANKGGAIFNNGNITSISGNFIGNIVSTNNGGGVLRTEGGTINSLSGNFIGNYTFGYGGVLSTKNASTRVNSISGNFIANYSDKGGGALNFAGITDTISGNFIGNWSNSIGGAAIDSGGATITSVTGDFISNTAYNCNGGAIISRTDSSRNSTISSITGNFISNKANNGGAIHHNSPTVMGISNSDFIANSAGNGSGGAIYLDNSNGTLNISDSNFTDNSSSTAYGGAIYTVGNLNIYSQSKDVLFDNNSVSDGYNDIYFSNSNKLNLYASDGRKIILNGGIKSDDISKIYKINNGGDYTGTVVMNGIVSNAQTRLYNGTLKLGSESNLDGTILGMHGGTLDLANGSLGTMNLNTIQFYDSSTYKLALDVDWAGADETLRSDRITSTTTAGNGVLTVSQINIKNIEAYSTITAQILDTTNSNFRLAIANDILPKVGDYYKFDAAEVAREDLPLTNNASWNTEFLTKVTYQDLLGSIETATTATTNDSIKISIVDVTGDPTYDYVSQGDTLRLMNQFVTDDPRSFTTNDSTATYTVGENLGTTSAGEFNINGDISGTDISIINFGDKTGFELDNQTALNFNNVRLNSNNAIATVTNSNASISLNNVILNNDITSSVNYALSTSGNTTINGSVANANLTNSGMLKVTKDGAFSSTAYTNNTGGKLNLVTNALESQTFGDFTLNDDLTYTFDVDLLGRNSDILHLASGSVVTGNGHNININSINLTSNSTLKNVNTILTTNADLSELFNLSSNIKSYMTGATSNYDNITYKNGVLSFYMNTPAVYSGTTLDNINLSSTSYLNGEHQKYTLTTTQGSHTNSIVIDGTTYYFTPDESSQALNETLVYLTQTGAVALVQGSESDYVFKTTTGGVTKYYTYQIHSLPMSAYYLTNASSEDYNIYTTAGVKNVVLKTDAMSDFTNLSWTKITPEAAAENYTWEDETNYPWASNINYNDSDGNLYSLNGAVRFKLPHTSVDEETGLNILSQANYYAYEYSVPSGYIKSGAIGSLDADVKGVYFYNISAGGDKGIAIHNTSTEGYDVVADFIGNTHTNSGGGYSSSIFTNSGGSLGSVVGNFIGNTSSAYGILRNRDNGTIDEIIGDFVANTMSKDGPISLDSGRVNTIKGNFTGNRARIGGGIHIYNATVGDISGNFIGNRATNNGGAINIEGETTVVNTITGSFIGNFAASAGGAILNAGTVGSITGDFIRNYINGNGAAIRNSDTGKIGTITGNFIGNYSGQNAGAIYNSGTIGSIRGDFIGNYNVSTNFNYAGGIVNNGTINSVTGNFINNISPNYGAIFNSGSSAYLGILADNQDVIFYGNRGGISWVKDGDGQVIDYTGGSYRDLYLSSSGNKVGLNAGTYTVGETQAQHKIFFGGNISGSNGPNLDINRGEYNADTDSYNLTNTGGKYIFNDSIYYNYVNLYNGADVKMGAIIQGRSASDGQTFAQLMAEVTDLETIAQYQADSSLIPEGENLSYGKFSLSSNSGLTTDTAGGSNIDFRNLHTDLNTLGAVSLGSDLTIQIDADLAQSNINNRVDRFEAGSILAGETKFIINGVSVLSDVDTTYRKAYVANSTLKSRFALSDNIITATRADGEGTYRIRYDESNGNLYFEQKAGLVANARNDYGFYDATRTYILNADEDIATQIANYGETSYGTGSIGSLSGTQLTIDGNSGAYSINGGSKQGITVGDGKTLIIQNVGSTTGSVAGGDFEVVNSINNFNNSVIVANSGSTINIDNSVFSNNKGHRAIRMDSGSNLSELSVTNSTFYGNKLGAIGTSSGTSASISNTNFINNGSAGSAVASFNNYGTSVLLNNNFIGNFVDGNTGSAIYNEGKINSLSGNFIGNASRDNNSSAAIRNNGELSFIGILADTQDTIFYGNKVAVTWIKDDDGNIIGNTGGIYRDLINQNGSVYLNAGTYTVGGDEVQRQILFGGQITGNSNGSTFMYINIGEYNPATSSYDLTNTGGKYVFNDTTQNNNIALCNGADVKMGAIIQGRSISAGQSYSDFIAEVTNLETIAQYQADSSLIPEGESLSYGKLSLYGFTTDSTGGSNIDFRNLHTDLNTLGQVSLGSDLTIQIDADLAQSNINNRVDRFEAGSILAGETKFIINGVSVLSDIDTTYRKAYVADNTLKSRFALSDNIITATRADGEGTYRIRYDEGSGYLYFEQNAGLVANARNDYGFYDASRTYTLNGDEDIATQIANYGESSSYGTGSIGTLSGTQLTIDGNSGAYSINGGNKQGITVGDGQTLIIQNVGSTTGSVAGGDFEILKSISGFNKVVTVNSGGTLNISNSVLTDSITNAAIYLSSGGDVSISNSTFANNTSSTMSFFSGSTGSITNTKFYNNSTIHNGGAVYSEGAITSITGEFRGNSTNNNGGAIYTRGTVDLIQGDFIENSASNGGAILNQGNTAVISSIQGNFINNTASGSGGAIFNNGSGTLTIQAVSDDIVFYNNRATGTATLSQYSDIYNEGGTVYLNANSNRTIHFGGIVTRNGTLGLNNHSSIKGGKYEFNNAVSQYVSLYNNAYMKLGAVWQGRDWLSLTDEQKENVFNPAYIKAGIEAETIAAADVTYGYLDLPSFSNDEYNGTLDVQNKHIDSNSLGAVTLGSDLYYKIDVSLSDQQADFLTASSLATTANKIIINDIDFMTDGTADVRLTNNVLMNNTDLSPDIKSADYIISSTGVRYKLRTEKVTSGYYSGLHLIANYYKLADAIASTATSSTYLLQPDSAKTYESADKNLGSLQGTSLIVDGGSETKYGINGANYSGVSIANGKTLTIQNVGSTSGSTITDSITGFESVNGGFVYNDGTLVLSNTVFSANSATTNGGAVYNGTNGTITLNGTNTFANNSANSLPNDIYNLGTITLAASSTTNINSGISGYHGLINMGSGAVLNVNGAVDSNTISLSNSTINIGSGKLYLEGLTNDANGGTIDSRNGRIDYNDGITDYTNYLGSVNLASDIYYNLDVDFENSIADSIVASVSASNNGKIFINEVNSISDFANGDSVKVADTVLMGIMDINNATHLTDASGIRYALAYDAVDDDGGYLTVDGYYRLPDAVAATDTTRTYTIKSSAVDENGQELIDRNLGLLGGTYGEESGNASLVIEGNGYGINMQNNNGITVQAGQSLTINNIGYVIEDDTPTLTDYKWNGYSSIGDGISALKNYGNLSLNNVVFSNNNAFSSRSPLFLVNNDTGIVDNISGKFENNNMQNVYAIYSDGGLINNSGKIGTINADFINNQTSKPTTYNSVKGTVVFNTGIIKSINGQINYNKNFGTHGSRGIIFNDGDNSRIGSISGSISNNIGHSAIISTSGSMTISGATIDSNIAANSSSIFIEEKGKVILKDSSVTNNIVSADKAVIDVRYDKAALYVVADEDNVLFDNNAAAEITLNEDGTATIGDISSYVDLERTGGSYVYLNSAENHNITFNGSVDSYILTINGTQNDVFLGIDNNYNDITGTINQQGGNYIFNNELTASTLYVRNGANIKLGSHEQQNGTTTYGHLNTAHFYNDVNGGNLDTQNGRVDGKISDIVDYSNVLGDVRLYSDLNYNLDVDFANSKADYLSGTLNSYNNGNIVIKSIQFLSEGSGDETIKIASKGLIGSVIADTGDYIIYNPSDPVRYTITTTNVTTGTDDEQGVYLTSSFYKLYDAVHSSGIDRYYTIKPDATKNYETVDHDLSTMGGDGASLTIDGGSTTKYGVNGDNKLGITVNEGQTLEIKNIGSWTQVKDADNKLTGLDITSSWDRTHGIYQGSTILGGVVYNVGGNVSVKDSIFTNISGYAIQNISGGQIDTITGAFQNVSLSAIYNNGSPSTIGTITADFINIGQNAIRNNYGTITSVINSNFINGKETAISNGRGYVTVENSYFANNLGARGSINERGGAIALVGNGTDTARLTIRNSLIENNYTQRGSGAGIGMSSATLVIEDTDFINNTSASTGGALNIHYGSTTISAINKDVQFTGNIQGATVEVSGNVVTGVTGGEANDISNDSNININAYTYLDSNNETQSRRITFNSGITDVGSGLGTLNINNAEGANGIVEFNSDVYQNTVHVRRGTLENKGQLSVRIGNLNNSGIIQNTGTIIQGADTAKIINTGSGTINSVADNLQINISNSGILNTSGTTAGNISNYIEGDGTINLDNGLVVAHEIVNNKVYLNNGTLKITRNNALTNFKLVGAEGTIIDLRTGTLEHQNLGSITLNGDMRIRLDADLGYDASTQTTHSAGIDTITGDVISAVSGKKIYVDAITILYDASEAPVEFKFAQGTVKNYIDIFADYKDTEIAGPTDNYIVTYENKSDGGYLGFDYAGLASAIQSTKDQKVFTMHHDDEARRDLGSLNGTKLVVVGNNNAVNGLLDNGDETYTHLKGAYIGDGKTMEISDVGLYDTENDVVVKSWNNFTNNYSGTSGGALNNWTGGTLKITDSVFSDNSASNGGAIFNNGTLTLSGTNYFVNNSASSGGAIFNNVANQVIGGIFIGNSATSAGGAILSNVPFEVADNSVFINNRSTGNAAAVLSNGPLEIGDNVSFSGNIAVNGPGTVFSASNITVGSGVKFENNTSSMGSAMYANGNISVGESALFDGNIASTPAPGGAIYSGAKVTIGNNSTFSNNINPMMAGAIYASQVDITGSSFENNYAIASTVGGGALYVNGSTAVESVITDTDFTNNATGGMGGAIFSGGNTTLSIIASGKDVEFSGNKSGANITYNELSEQYEVSGGIANDIHNVGILKLKAGTYVDDYDQTQPRSITFNGSITDQSNKVGRIIIGNEGEETGYLGTVNFNDTVTQKSVTINSGNVYINANNLAVDTLTNSASLNLKDGALATNISGIAGTTNIIGNVSSDKVVNQAVLTVASGKKYTNTNSTTINSTLTNSGSIDNSGTIVIGTTDGTPTGGNLGKFVDTSSTGSLTLNGGTGITYINNSSDGIVQNTFVNNANLTNNNKLQAEITNTGNITSSATNLKGTIANSGEVNLTGGSVQANITKNGTSGGTVKISNSVTLGSEKSISGNDIELTSGSTLKLHGGSIANATSLVAKSNSTLDMQDESISSSYVNIGNVDLSSSDLKITIDANLATVKADKITAESIAGDNHIVISGINILEDATSTVPTIIDVADNMTRTHIILGAFADDPIDGITDSYLVTYDDGGDSRTTGQLTFGFANLENAVKSLAQQKTYIMGDDELVTGDLTPFNGTTLTIKANNHAITGSSAPAPVGLTVGAEQTLNLTGASDVSGFSDGVFLTNNGETNITDSVISDAIVNNSELNFNGTNSVGPISGTTSTTTVQTGKTTFNGAISQTSIVVDKLTNKPAAEAIFNANVTASLTNKGSTTLSNATTLQGTVNNNASLTNNGIIGTDSNKNTITNSGTLTNKGTIKATTITNTGNLDNTNGTTISAATITNNGEDGVITSAANKIITTNKITNNSLLNFTEGLNSNIIDGTGTLKISGNTQNTASISQKALNVTSGTFTNNAPLTTLVTITDGITNSGSIANNGSISVGTGTPTGGNLGLFSGSGVLTLNGGTGITYTNNSASGITQGTVINNANIQNNNDLIAAVTNNGTITSNASKLKGVVTNSNNTNITLTGGSTTYNILGTGKVTIQNEVILNNSTGNNSIELTNNSTLKIRTDGDISNNSSLVAKGGTIDLADGNIGESVINLGNINISNADLKVLIDTDLSTEPGATSDIISANSVTGYDETDPNTKQVLISDINLMHKSTHGVPVDVQIAQGTIISSIDLAAGIKTGGKSAEGESYMLTYDKTTGNLNFSYSGLYSAVKSESSSRAYNMGEDENVTQDLGDMGGPATGTNKGTLTINGNGYSINGNDNEGINVNADQTLYVNEVGALDSDGNVTKSYNGFETAINVAQEGKLTVENSVFDGNTTDVNNNGEFTLKGSNTFNDKITSSENKGEMTVTNGTSNFNSSVTQKDITINDGAIANFKDNVVSNITNSGIANNNKKITGDVANTGDNALFNNKNATVEGNVETSGIFDNSNNGIVTGNANITGGTFNNEVGHILGNVTNSGELNTNLNNISGTIANNGTMNVSGGNVSNDITGIGTTNVNNNIVNTKNITQNNINIASNKLITNMGNLTVNNSLNNKGSILGTGNLNIGNNAVADNSNGLIVQDTISVSDGASVKTNANNFIALNGINNDGTITYTGGSVNNKISGSANGNVNLGDNPTSSTSVVMPLNSKISGNQINLNNAIITFGSNADISNAASFNINAGAMDVMDGKLTSTKLGNVKLNGKSNLAIDFNLSNLTSDTFVANVTNNGGMFNINKLNLVGTTLKNNIKVQLGDTTGLGASNVTSDTFDLPSIMTPVIKINGRVEDGYLIYAPAGNKYTDFNPAVLATPIAAQVGGYLSQINSYDEAFRNLDMKMLMTQEERNAWKLQNRYASEITPQVYSSLYLPEKDHALWARPYATFEHVGLNNGPNVNNTMYGTFFGGDSEMKELRHGWDYQWSAYVGYNGSHQSYSGVDIYQNGGNLGVTSAWFKGNFFTALTANVGASVADESTMFGSEDIPMIMGGVASKTGYNIQLAKGKFIIQPNYLMSYTFVQTINYKSKSGAHINGKALNGIQIAPGLKLIGNLKGGWQPYASVRMVWNTVDKTRYTAEDIALPQMSVAPYIQYGLGLQKRWGDRFTGFLQAMARSGGRNGVALSAGFRWTIGKGSDDNQQSIKEIKQTSSSKLPSVQQQKTVVKTTKEKPDAAKVENKQSQNTQNTNKKGFFRRLLDAMNKSSSVKTAQNSDKKVLKSLSYDEKNHIEYTTRTKQQAYVDNKY